MKKIVFLLIWGLGISLFSLYSAEDDFNKNLEYIKLIEEIKSNVYNFKYNNREIEKEKLNQLSKQINITDPKELEKIKDNLFLSSVFFESKQGLVFSLSIGANINAGYKISPLSIAIINNDIDTIKTLIDYGININKEDETGYSPIFWAIFSSNNKIFYLIEDAGGDISTVLKNRTTPLKTAVDTENIEIIEYLLKKNVFIDDDYRKLIPKEVKNPDIVNILKKYKLM